MSNIDNLSLEGFLEFAKEANTRSTLAVEDGLKPVHRRILYAMAESKIFADKQHVKSAKVVGEVLGNYHPHGDASVYDAAVRMSQEFKMRYPLIDFYGNHGSILEPDNYAASRYTSMRLSPLGQMMLEDLNKNTVDMVENYSGDLIEPVILPSRIPNVLLNGGMGIGVGVSSSLVPHNLGEIADAINAYIKNPRITTEELMQFIQGPDFPTGGVIVDGFSLAQTYENGKGSVKVRAKYNLQTVGGRTHIVITEIPYLVSIEERVIAPIQKMIVEESYDKVYDIQNNSGKHGLELRIILEKDVNPTTVLKDLFEKTGLEATIKINNTVLLPDGNFVTLNLRGLIGYYIKHQHNILIRRYTWDLNKAKERLNIVEGLIIAIQNIDEVVAIIKASESTAKAKVSLINRFKLNEAQAAAILDMKLARLTSLEINKLMDEKKELLEEIAFCNSIINSELRRNELISDFLTKLKAKFGDGRRTKISEVTIVEKGEHVYLIAEGNNQFSSVPKEDIALTAKGRKGTQVVKMPVNDIIECNTKDEVLILESTGKVTMLTAREILDGKFVAENKIIQLLKPEEKDYVIFVTKDGIIKKTAATKFKKTTQFTKVREEDAIIKMLYANDTDHIMVLGVEGKCSNIPVSEIAAMGKLTFGSKGVSTAEVIDATIASSSDDLILTVTKDSQGKLTRHDDFLVTSKGATGAVIVEDCRQIMNVGTATQLAIFGKDGKAITIEVNSLSIKGRAATGAKIYGSEISKIVRL